MENDTHSHDEARAFFKGNIPTRLEIRTIQEKISAYNEQAAIAKEHNITASDKERLAELKQLFSYGVPQEEQLDEAQKMIEQFEAKRKQSQNTIVDTADIIRLEQLKERFGENRISYADIERVAESQKQVRELEKKLVDQKIYKQDLKSRETRKGRKYNSMMLTMFMTAGIVVVLGLAVLIFFNRYLGIGLEIGGLLTAVAGMLLIKPEQDESAGEEMEKTEQEIAETESQIEKMQLGCVNFIKEYGRKNQDDNPAKAIEDIRTDWNTYLELEKTITSMNEEHAVALKEANELKQPVEEFLKLYTTAEDSGRYMDCLTQIRNDVKEYQSLKDAIAIHNQAVKTALEYKDEIYTFIEQYFDTVDRPAEQLRTISQKLDQYEAAGAEA